jgi:methionyl-tRNA formyltransferase
MRAVETLQAIRALAPEALVVVAFGRILPASILSEAPRGGINVHASLLPRLRGAAPVAWAIARGDTETGVTTMQMTERLDAGDILLMRSTPIGEAETAGELQARLSSMGADLLIETLDALELSQLASLPQDESKATLAPIIRKEDALVDWSAPAQEIARRVRAFHPWPVAWTTTRGRLLRLHRARASSDPVERVTPSAPGQVLSIGPSGVRVACGSGALDLEAVQPEGRRAMKAAEAAAGRWLVQGQILGG